MENKLENKDGRMVGWLNRMDKQDGYGSVVVGMGEWMNEKKETRSSKYTFVMDL